MNVSYDKCPFYPLSLQATISASPQSIYTDSTLQTGMALCNLSLDRRSLSIDIFCRDPNYFKGKFFYNALFRAGLSLREKHRSCWEQRESSKGEAGRTREETPSPAAQPKAADQG